MDSFSSPELDLIEYYKKFPIYINKCKAEELSVLPGITLSIAYKIIEIINENQYSTINFIADTLGLTPVTELILQSCTFFENGKFKPKFLNLTVRNQQPLQETHGLINNDFEGSPLDFYSKMNFKSGPVAITILSNKDAGEKDLLDFYSGSLSYNDRNFSVVIGDFNSTAGMGNILWRSFGARKGGDILSPSHITGKSFSSNQSTIDYQYMRGLAGKYTFNMDSMKLIVNAFVSNTDRSGTSDSLDVSSIYTSGYYRTQSEISKKDAFKELAMAFNPELIFGNSKFGILLLSLNYDKVIDSKSSRFFNGKSGLLSSIYCSYDNSKLLFSSELSMDAQQNIGNKTAFSYNFKKVGLSTLFRYFAQDFRSPFGYNFGESAIPSNEIGLYTGVEFKISTGQEIGVFTDFYETITRTYLIPAKVRGTDLWFEYRNKINSSNTILLRFRNENKTDSKVDVIDNGRKIYSKSRYSLRAELMTDISRKLSMRLRTEFCKLSFESKFPVEVGFSSFFEMKWQPTEKFSIGSRYSIYSTDSFESAIWQFEYSFPGLMTTHANYGDGARFYIYSSLKLAENIELRARYATTSKNNVKSLGSSYSEVFGNQLSNLIFQVDFGL